MKKDTLNKEKAEMNKAPDGAKKAAKAAQKASSKKTASKKNASKKASSKKADSKKANSKKAAGAKPKTKKQGKRTNEVRSASVPLFRSLRLRLILSFFVPVICIIVLGVASYQKASRSIVANYKESSSQTADMMRQYVELVVNSEKDNFKPYVIDADMRLYFSGLKSEYEEASTGKTYADEIRNMISLDRKLASIYFLGDEGRSIYVGSSKLPDDAYAQYIESAQGKMVSENTNKWYLLGQDRETDEPLGIATDDYSLRLAYRMGSLKAIMLINLDASYIRDAMVSLDPGKGGYVALVTADGKEFYSDESQFDEPLIYGTDFYQKALESEDITGNRSVELNGKAYLFVYSRLEEGDAMVAALIPSEQLLAQSREIQLLSIVLTAVAAVIAIGLGMLISGQISRTINYILAQLNKVSHGDLTVHLETKKKDELGMLCVGVNDTIANVKNLIVTVNDVSSQLTDAAAYVTDASGTFMNTSQDIQQAVSEIEIGVNKLDSGSENCLNQMDSLSGKITNVSVNADEIGKLTSSTGQTINDGIQSVQGLTKSAESTSQITREVIEAIEELEEKSRSISKIVSAINDIAEQTNLLSLNASIEAARAGEAGRGFAVVAEEIRKLSDQCLNSAGQISSIVTEIVGKTGEVVEIARQAEEVVSTQAGAVEDTTNSFRSIDQQVKSLLDALGTISSNVEEMNSSRSETLEAIESISAVSAETAASSTSVYTTAGTQLDASQELGKAANQLRERADRLVEILRTFHV